MPNRSRASRAGTAVIRGRRRAEDVAARLGVALRAARREVGRTQAQAAEAAGISQSRYSELERG